MIRSFLVDRSANGGYEFRNIHFAARPLIGETVTFIDDGQTHTYKITKISHISEGERVHLALEGVPADSED